MVVFLRPPAAAQNGLEGKSIEFGFAPIKFPECLLDRGVAFKRLKVGSHLLVQEGLKGSDAKIEGCCQVMRLFDLCSRFLCGRRFAEER